MTDRKEIDTTRPCFLNDGGGSIPAELLCVLQGVDRDHVWKLTRPHDGLQWLVYTDGDGYGNLAENRQVIINTPQTREVWLAGYRNSDGKLIFIERHYDSKPDDIPEDGGACKFIGWQHVTITDQPQGDD